MGGVLNDKEIKEYVRDGKLICEDYEEKNIKQACYELRVGNAYYDLSSGGDKYSIDEDKAIVLKPHQRIVIVTKEKLIIPNDILARIITKGSLFSIGISPVCTYADPGFQGKLGIVIQNVSNDYIKIPSGMSIAKIEFSKLEYAVENEYHGQHGFETEIWPIRNDLIIKQSDIKKNISSYNTLDEIELAFGKPVADMLSRIVVAEKRLLVVTLIFMISNLCIIWFSAGEKWLEPLMSVALGIITNLVYSIITLIVARKK